MQLQRLPPWAAQGTQGWLWRFLGRPPGLRRRPAYLPRPVRNGSYGHRRQRFTIHAAALEADAGLHTLAEKWIPGLAVITGTFGLAAVVVNKDAVKTLSDFWTIWAYALVVAATLMAVSATILVYRAAFGWPQEVDFRSAASTAAAAESFSSRTVTRGRRLRTAVGLSLALLWPCLLRSECSGSRQHPPPHSCR